MSSMTRADGDAAIDPVSVGVAGCGSIAQSVHLPALADLPEMRLVAVADVDTERLHEAVQKAPGAVPYAGYGAMIDRSDAEAVVICLPAALHRPAAQYALRAGKHVYVEKPLAHTLADGRALVEAGRSSALVGQIGFNYRFDPLHERARRMIRSGEIGRLTALRTAFSSSRDTLPPWKRTRDTGGGAMLDLASHHIDLVLYLTGLAPVRVHGRVRSMETDHDVASLALMLEEDVTVQSLFSMRSVTEDRFEIYGREGKLQYDRYTSADVEVVPLGMRYGRWAQLRRELRALGGSLRRVIRAPGEPSFARALSAFARAIRGRAVDIPSLEDGYRALRIVEAAERSADRSEPVAVESTAA